MKESVGAMKLAWRPIWVVRLIAFQYRYFPRRSSKGGSKLAERRAIRLFFRTKMRCSVFITIIPCSWSIIYRRIYETRRSTMSREGDGHSLSGACLARKFITARELKRIPETNGVHSERPEILGASDMVRLSTFM